MQNHCIFIDHNVLVCFPQRFCRVEDLTNREDCNSGADSTQDRCQKMHCQMYSSVRAIKPLLKLVIIAVKSPPRKLYHNYDSQRCDSRNKGDSPKPSDIVNQFFGQISFSERALGCAGQVPHRKDPRLQRRNVEEVHKNLKGICTVVIIFTVW